MEEWSSQPCCLLVLGLRPVIPADGPSLEAHQRGVGIRRLWGVSQQTHRDPRQGPLRREVGGLRPHLVKWNGNGLPAWFSEAAESATLTRSVTHPGFVPRAEGLSRFWDFLNPGG